MIVVLSLNTALDRIVVVPHFAVGQVHRATATQVAAGGKGLNVARVLRQLGHPVRVVGFLGGAPADPVRRQCNELGIEQRWIAVPDDSRTCTIVVDPQTREQTVVNEQGPHVSPPAIEELCEVVEEEVGEGDILCISGSAPPGAPDDLYASLISAVGRRKARVLVDVSGAALRLSLQVHPWAAAPNREELQAMTGDVAPIEGARRLARLAQHAILTLGAEGALYAVGDRVHQLRPPLITAVNAVGSGDALVAGFLAGIESGLSALDALRIGIACGASNAGRLSPGIASLEEVRRLYNAVAIVDLSET